MQELSREYIDSCHTILFYYYTHNTTKIYIIIEKFVRGWVDAKEIIIELYDFTSGTFNDYSRFCLPLTMNRYISCLNLLDNRFVAKELYENGTFPRCISDLICEYLGISEESFRVVEKRLEDALNVL